MKQRKFLLSAVVFLLLPVALCCCGCDSQGEEAPSTTTENNDLTKVFQSDFGYKLEYDDDIFFVLTDSSSDSFGLWNTESALDRQVHITAQRVRGYTVKEYSDMLVADIEQGIWTVTEADFGAEKEDATTVSYEKTTDDGKLLYSDTLVKSGADLIVVERVTYEGMPEEINTAIEAMLNTFTVTR